MNINSIKFSHAQGGKLQYCKGHTPYSNLFELGALALTTRYKSTGNSSYREFATDDRGLEASIMKANETLEFMQNAIVALGLVMSDDESQPVKENRSELTWLVTGLAELSGMISNNVSEMNHTLGQLKGSKINE